MPPEIYPIAVPAAGRLWIMPRPLDLVRDIAAYRAEGVQHIVSMLAVDEAETLGLRSEWQACRAQGIGFTQHPIEDFGLPDMADFAALVRQIRVQLEAGENTAVHCRAGIGRSGMVTCGVLVALGMTADAAIARVSQARGISVPDTDTQAGFIAMFAKTWGA